VVCIILDTHWHLLKNYLLEQPSVADTNQHLPTPTFTTRGAGVPDMAYGVAEWDRPHGFPDCWKGKLGNRATSLLSLAHGRH
jgi:hypothetical protein